MSVFYHTPSFPIHLPCSQRSECKPVHICSGLDGIHQIVGTAWGSLGKAAGIFSSLGAMGNFWGSLLILFPNSHGLQASTCPCGSPWCLWLRLESWGKACANGATTQWQTDPVVFPCTSVTLDKEVKVLSASSGWIFGSQLHRRTWVWQWRKQRVHRIASVSGLWQSGACLYCSIDGHRVTHSIQSFGHLRYHSLASSTN